MTRDWRSSVIEYIRTEARPVDKFGHQPRLYALATEIGRGMDYDDDVLFAAAWMHDLGVFLGHRPQDPKQLSRWDHVPYTIQRSRELLSDFGFPPAKLDAVSEAILHHQPKDDPTTVEATLLRDADILEQLGAIGLLRAAVKVGRDTRYPTFTSILPVLTHAVNQLANQTRLAQTKVMAQSRAEMLRSFLAALENEARDQLY
ncbi:MAG: HD domain-containing protein [Acidobacteria bacterium]|nr:HD domain-containing protein [Acidobacteriota bacterium]